MEKITFVHLSALMLVSAWCFGGNIWWIRPVLSVWANLGLFITLAALRQPGAHGRENRRRVWWLLPWLLFILLVVVSAFNPSFRPLTVEGDTVLLRTGAENPLWPSSMNPSKSLHELWFYASVYLAAFNLLLIPRSRRFLRLLIMTGALSCLLLAIFGTLQKLVEADLYFGLSQSPNPRFFSTFIYNNHWGAFMILWLCATAGIIFNDASSRSRDLWHSPFTLAVVGLLLIAASAPVSASRAATGLAVVVLITVLSHGLVRICITRRAAHRSIAPPILMMAFLALSGTAAIGWLAQRSIDARYQETLQTLARNQSLFGVRAQLYSDTWELAKQKPAFGWGLESFASAHELIQPRKFLINRNEMGYVEAHCDWLQSLAETGFAGTILAMAMGLIPLFAFRRNIFGSPLSQYPLFGCALVALYAWFEFPFANGAVLISFWILFFSAMRYARLQSQTSSTTSHS
ncbi:MAG: O-antigen ligase family protein [Opitutaceae bacterium]|nr:O-antigen ligase family protein [Opitutaceae bacterium]